MLRGKSYKRNGKSVGMPYLTQYDDAEDPFVFRAFMKLRLEWNVLLHETLTRRHGEPSISAAGRC